MADLKKMTSVALPVEVVEALLSRAKISDALRDLAYASLRQDEWADRFAKVDDMLRQDPGIQTLKLATTLEQLNMPLPIEVIQWHLRRGAWELRKPK